jgi:hypothetical protein
MYVINKCCCGNFQAVEDEKEEEVDMSQFMKKGAKGGKKGSAAASSSSSSAAPKAAKAAKTSKK